MHDGVYQSLWDVVNHYNFGGATGPLFGSERSRARAPDAHRCRARDLVEFLRALDDGDVLPAGRFLSV